jgi:hypothetical protein
MFVYQLRSSCMLPFKKWTSDSQMHVQQARDQPVADLRIAYQLSRALGLSASAVARREPLRCRASKHLFTQKTHQRPRQG